MVTVAATEKTVEELHKEIEELHLQQCEITDHLCDPHILHRSNCTPRSNGPGIGLVPCLRGFVRPTPVSEDQSAPNKCIIFAVVKVDNREAKLEMSDAAKEQDLVVEGKLVPVTVETHSARPRAFIPLANCGAVRNDSYTRRRSEFDLTLSEMLPRVLLKDEVRVWCLLCCLNDGNGLPWLLMWRFNGREARGDGSPVKPYSCI